MKLTSSAAALVLLLAVGCGGAESEFTEDYNRAVQPVAQYGRALGGGPAGYERLARRVRAAAGRLAGLRDVPDGARDELERVALQLRRVANRLEAVATAQRLRNPRLQRAAARSLERTNERFKRAENALRRAVEG